ncbi:hypothetical protein FSP39_005893 [Pinctada imbricata]|uniref:CARD domain-containing protein n=1 Tax=Pinctada imbricata TaxID=66713 RepID=A0AA88XXD4_PINIB|nr:hypothetical protein FSP39_005893 [Pinctada imbricata]
MENLNKSSGHKRTRLFLVKLQRYGPERFEKFLDLLQCEYGDLAETLRKHLEEKKLLNQGWYCLCCKIEKDVDLNDIVDFLYQERIICLNDMDEVLNNNDWRLLRRCINTSKNTFEIFISSMNRKYGHLVSELKKHTKLQCICDSMNALPDPDSSSEADSVAAESVESMAWWTHYERRGLVRHATFYQRKRVLSGLCRHESLIKKTVVSNYDEPTTVPSKSSSFPSLKSQQLSATRNHKASQSLEIVQSTPCLSCNDFPFPLLENILGPCRSQSSPNFALPICYNESRFSEKFGSFRPGSLMEISENNIEMFVNHQGSPQAFNEDIQEDSFGSANETCQNLPNCDESLCTHDSDDESIMYYDENNPNRRNLRRNTAMRYSKGKADTIREKYIRH